MPVPAPETLTLPLGTARVEWRRSQRARRISLRIDPRGGVVVVTLPPRAGRAAGMALLADHADWVADRLAALPGAVTFADGATVPLDGTPHPIRHVPGGRGGAWLTEGTIQVSGEAVFLSRRVGDFLREEARRRLALRVAAAAEAAGLTPRRVTVKDTRTRWGSCSSTGVLMFCWRLVMAPPLVQEYVVAHELAHLRHMNHGKAFWALVDTLTPHRAAAVAWLHEEGPRLLRIG
ncbi:MAG TPA: SprT family zinc-dependent metalloprotease [Acetobacteraceae bacterium]|nr:SprT family zinc-dependent metalloprotease [Acetobacteraceae bacterium]